MLCLASLLLHTVPCSQLTNQHKPGCCRMQPLPPAVPSLQCWLRGGSVLCFPAGMDAGSRMALACLGWAGKELVVNNGW